MRRLIDSRKNAIELAVLVNDKRVGESEAKLDFHDGRGEGRRVGFLNWLHDCKRAHPTASNQVDCGSFESGMGASLIAVNMQDLEWALDWEVVDQFGRALLRWIF